MTNQMGRGGPPCRARPRRWPMRAHGLMTPAKTNPRCPRHHHVDLTQQGPSSGTAENRAATGSGGSIAPNPLTAADVDRYAEQRDEEQPPEQKAPESAARAPPHHRCRVEHRDLLQRLQ